MTMPTDTDLLDWLERQNATAPSRGMVSFQRATSKKRWRLFEALLPVSGNADPRVYSTVRAAIAAAMDEEQE